MPLYRLTRTHHPDPAFFGRLRAYRVDAPEGLYGVRYLGTTLACCLLDVLNPRRDAATGRQFVATTQPRASYTGVADAHDLSTSRARGRRRSTHAAQADSIFYATRHHTGRLPHPSIEPQTDIGPGMPP